MNKYVVVIDGKDSDITTVDLSKVLRDNFDNLKYTIAELESIQKMSDGYHTFEELYHHRMMLFSVICNSNRWKR